MRDQRAPTTHQPPSQPLPLSSLKAGLKTWRWFGWGGRPLTQPSPSPTFVKVPTPPRIWGRTVSTGLHLSCLGFLLSRPGFLLPWLCCLHPSPHSLHQISGHPGQGTSGNLVEDDAAGRGSGCPPLRWALMGSGFALPPLRSPPARLEVATNPHPEKGCLLQCRWRCWQWLVA